MPDGPWQIVTSDLITGLSESDGKTVILITVNRFMKQCHLLATTDKIDAPECMSLYICDVFKHYGAPKEIITDRRLQFAFCYLQRIYKEIGTKPSLSMAYHL